MNRLKAVAVSSIVALGLGMGMSAQAFPEPPAGTCGPANEGQTVAVEQFDWTGNGRRYVYTCYANGWLLTEIWYCGDYGGGYTCTVM